MIPKKTTMTAIVTMTTTSMAMKVAHGGAVVIALALWKKGCRFDSPRCCVLAIWRRSLHPNWMGSQTAAKPHPESCLSSIRTLGNTNNNDKNKESIGWEALREAVGGCGDKGSSR